MTDETSNLPHLNGARMEYHKAFTGPGYYTIPTTINGIEATVFVSGEVIEGFEDRYGRNIRESEFYARNMSFEANLSGVPGIPAPIGGWSLRDPKKSPTHQFGWLESLDDVVLIEKKD